VKELRENAEECMGWARSARSDKERSIFLQMARAWSEVAERRKTAHTGQPNEKTERWLCRAAQAPQSLCKFLRSCGRQSVVVDAEFAGVAGAKPDGLVSIQATEDADVSTGAI
jgi:hypothetical protein